MLGISFAKIVVLVAVIAFVWFGWRWFQRWELERRMPPQRGARDRTTPRQIAAEDMEACRVCGTYVAAQAARGCGRGDCPYPR